MIPIFFDDGALVADHFFICCWSYLVGVGLGNKQKLRSEISQIKKKQITKNENQGSLLLNRMWCVLLVQLGFLNWWGLHILCCCSYIHRTAARMLMLWFFWQMWTNSIDKMFKPKSKKQKKGKNTTHTQLFLI